MTLAFTLKVGDLIEAMPEGGAKRPSVYRVLTIAENGAAMTENVKTHKLRSFAGYGRLLSVEEANRTHRGVRVGEEP